MGKGRHLRVKILKTQTNCGQAVRAKLISVWEDIHCAFASTAISGDAVEGGGARISYVQFYDTTVRQSLKELTWRAI